MAGKIFIPSTENPLTPPPSGHYLFWIDDQGFFKKMDSDGNITNLSAQSLNDLNDTTLSTLEDGHILIYDQNTDKWVNQDFHEVGVDLKIPSLYDENGDVRIEATSTGLEVPSQIIQEVPRDDIHYSLSEVDDKKVIDVKNKAYEYINQMYHSKRFIVKISSDENESSKVNFEVGSNELNIQGTIKGFVNDGTHFFRLKSNSTNKYMAEFKNDGSGSNIFKSSYGNKLVFNTTESDNSNEKSVLTLGYDSSSFETDVDVKNNSIRNLKLPDSGSDAANKQYVDNAVANAGGGGGGSGSHLVDSSGTTRIEATTSGVDITGTTKVKATGNTAYLDVLDSDNGDAKTIKGGIYGTAIQYRIFDNRGFQFRMSPDQDNGNLTNIFSVLPDKIIPWKFLDAKEGLSVTGLISSFTATNENILKISDTTKNEVVTKLYNADSDLYLIGHKKHGFSFRMTDENDANEASKLAIGWSKITSVVPHHFDDGMRVKGQIHSDTDGMSQASLLSTTPVNGVDVELHKIIPSLNQVRYATRNNAQHIFSIDNADGNDMHDVTIMGLNGTVHTTKHQFNGGASMFGNKLESLADPISNDDAATKSYVDTEIANNSGSSNQLVDNNGNTRLIVSANDVKSKVKHWCESGLGIKKSENGVLFEYQPLTGANAGTRVFSMTDFGGPTKFQSRHGRGVQFQVYDSSDQNPTPVVNIYYDSIESKKLHKFSGGIEAEEKFTVKTPRDTQDSFAIYDENDNSKALSIDHGTSGVNFRFSKDLLFIKDSTTMMEMGSDKVSFQKKVIANGDIQAPTGTFSNVVIDNYLGGSLLTLGSGETKWFDFKNRSNQNKIICPTGFVLNFMFDDNGTATNSLTIGKGLCISDTDFQFNGYTIFKQELDVSNKKIKNLATPTSGSDAATKSYVDTSTFTLERIRLGDNSWQSVTVSETLLELLQKFDTLLATGGIADGSITFDRLSTTAYSEDLTVSSDCEELATANAVKNYVDATMTDESTRREFLSTSFTANTPLSFNHGLQKKLVIAQVFDSDGNSVEFHQKCVDNENVHLTIGIDGVFDVLILG